MLCIKNYEQQFKLISLIEESSTFLRHIIEWHSVQCRVQTSAKIVTAKLMPSKSPPTSPALRGTAQSLRNCKQNSTLILTLT